MPSRYNYRVLRLWGLVRPIGGGRLDPPRGGSRIPRLSRQGRWEAENLTMNVTGAGSMSLRINAEVCAKNVIFLSQGPGYANMNLVLESNLSANRLGLRSYEGGMVAVQTTGQIRSDELTALWGSARIDIFKWGSILLGPTTRVSARRWTAPRSRYGLGRRWLWWGSAMWGRVPWSTCFSPSSTPGGADLAGRTSSVRFPAGLGAKATRPGGAGRPVGCHTFPPRGEARSGGHLRSRRVRVQRGFLDLCRFEWVSLFRFWVFF